MKVSSIIQLKANIIEEFKDEVPNTLDFDIGWFKENTKEWLVVAEDLDRMYAKCTGNEICLWCDASIDKSNPKKRKTDSSGSRRQDGEDAVESIYQDLLIEHSDAYSKPQLRLWARMIHCGTHDDYNDPPRVPLITGAAPNSKRQKNQNSVSDAFTDAARAVANVFSPPVNVQNTNCSVAGVSPGKTVELRSKNLEQLRYIQQLYEDNILSDVEFAEQKRIILDAIRKLK